MDAIILNDVYKKFRMYYGKSHTLKERVILRNRNPYEERWVLKGIDLRIREGEVVGLVGENGSGKSTLLKLMTRILYPDKGEIHVNGRVSSLIELGAGFHPDMTGRENIYTNASIFGLSRNEINKRIDSIIDFSELGYYIDNPVRYYSSGMYMRLAFSVAINVDADILLIDEILSVGDQNFQRKCISKLQEICKSGTTIVIVSHSLGQIEKLCSRSIWIDDGKIRMDGAPRDVHLYYQDFLGKKIIEARRMAESEKESAQQDQNNVAVSRNTSREAWVESVEMINRNGEVMSVFETGDKVTIRIRYSAVEPGLKAIVSVGVVREDGVHCFSTNTAIAKMHDLTLMKNGTIDFVIDNMNLLNGYYFLDVALSYPDGNRLYDYVSNASTFQMISPDGSTGLMRMEGHWSVD
ncbi:MAG TPA: ABC transporter ATP-binding protein [Clostridiales bacterium]|nr:ABC transporter ATP-binding protein [Clostridiales bacterium]